MALKEIKNEIKSANRIGKVTKAMQSVSLVKMRKAQKNAINTRPFVSVLFSLLKTLEIDKVIKRTKLCKNKKADKTAIVMFTTDRGLVGSLNVYNFRALESILKGKKISDFVFYCVGNKSFDYVTRLRGDIVYRSECSNIKDRDLTRDLTKKVMEDYEAGVFDKCQTLYTSCVSTMTQQASFLELFPFKSNNFQNILSQASILNKGNNVALDEITIDLENTIIEPNAEDFVYLSIPFFIEAIFYHCILEMHASEHSARMITMQNATKKTEEISYELTRKYNKARQAQITKEIVEIVSSMEALTK